MRSSLRHLHRSLAPLISVLLALSAVTGVAYRVGRTWFGMDGLLLLPLVATALTGILYKIGQSWFGISEETPDLLMTIHEGAWLGKNLRVYYSVILGGSLLSLGLTGLFLLKPKRAANS